MNSHSMYSLVKVFLVDIVDQLRLLKSPNNLHPCSYSSCAYDNSFNIWTNLYNLAYVFKARDMKLQPSSKDPALKPHSRAYTRTSAQPQQSAIAMPIVARIMANSVASPSYLNLGSWIVTK